MLLVGAAAIVMVLAIAAAVILLARTSGTVEVIIGDTDFRDMDTDRISAEIADRGPILFGDVAGGELDIILQHLGDDPERGWLAFEARRPGQHRDCYFQWQASSETFVNSCDTADTVDAVGSGLRHFDVEVVEGDVRVDISER